MSGYPFYNWDARVEATERLERWSIRLTWLYLILSLTWFAGWLVWAPARWRTLPTERWVESTGALYLPRVDSVACYVGFGMGFLIAVFSASALLEGGIARRGKMVAAIMLHLAVLVIVDAALCVPLPG